MNEMLPHEIVLAALGILVIALAIFEFTGVVTVVGLLFGGILVALGRAPAAARAKHTSRAETD
jgi:hypothetical protein